VHTSLVYRPSCVIVPRSGTRIPLVAFLVGPTEPLAIFPLNTAAGTVCAARNGHSTVCTSRPCGS
jgi:hypothetical protein